MNGRCRYYILVDRTPIAVDLATWAEWFETKLRHVAVTTVDEDLGVYVSTVFLGVDHNLSGHGDPVLFETMAFGPAPVVALGRLIESTEMAQRRYCTYAEAEAGHANVVAEVEQMLAKTKAAVTVATRVKGMP